MADKQAGGLSLRIGLTLSQLQSDFLAAEQTVKQGIAAINRQQNIIKLRTEADLAGLDAVADKTKIIEVQERSLTQLLDLQRDKLKLATAAYQDVAQSKGANSAAAKQLETSMERERLAVARLEAQLKSLSAQKISVDTTHLQDTISKLNARIQHIKIQAEIDTSKLKGANAAFDAQKIHIAAVTKEIELQREKLTQLQAQMYKAAQANGAGSVQTLNIKSNVLQQIQQINQLEAKLKELRATNINLQVRADSLKQVEASIHENIARINAKIEHIRVKTDIDVSKLGAAATEFDKAKAHVQGLNRELDLQNKKLAEMRKALATSISTNGLNNVKTINLQTEIQKQIQAINQLKAKIQELNNIAPPKTNSLLSGYQNLKGNFAGKINELSSAFTSLQGATTSTDAAITSVLSVIGKIPASAGLAVAALVGIPLVFRGIENSIISMTRAAAASGDAVYVMSRGMQMSVKDAGKFSTNAKVAGAQVNDLAMAVKNVQRQVARGGEDSRAAEYIKRYGESAYDASGNIKDLNEMTFSLNRALKRAQAEGKGAEFVLNVFRNVSADAITAIEDWADVNEQASKIVKAGLANPKLAHEVQGNLNALNVQSAQLGTSFTNALLPVANEIIPRMTDRLGKMTSLISDNKDVILAFGRDFAEVWGAVEDTVDKVGEGLGVLAKLARDNRVVRQTSQKDIVERYKDDASIQNSKDLVEREIAAGGYTDEDIKKLRARNDLYLKELKQTDQDMKAVWAKRREEFAKQNEAILRRYADDDSIKTATDLLNKLTDAEKEAIEKTPSKFFGSMLERVAVLRTELEKFRAEAEAAKKEFLDTLNESNKIEGLRGAKGDTSPDLSADARKDYEDEQKKYRDLSDELYKATHNDFDNRKFELDKWHGEMVNGVENTARESETIEKIYAAKSAQIEQERADKLKEIRDSIAAADKTALQNKLDTIDKERQAWIKAGMDEAEATELAEKKKLQARQEAAEKAQEYLKNAADIEYKLIHSAFEKQLRDIEQWKDAQMKKAETAEEVAGIIKNAAAKEAEAFEAAMDRIKGKLQSLDDKIFAQEHSQYEQDRRRIEQERLEYYDFFQEQGALTDNARNKIERWYNNELGKLNQRAKQGGDYTKPPESAMQRGGNGIMVIGGDKILDDGLTQSRQKEIGLIADESQERAQLMQRLPQETRDRLAAIESTRQLSEAQKLLEQQTRQTASGIQVIAGDQIVSQPQVIEDNQVVSDLQQFGDALQHQVDPIKALQDSAQDAATAQKSLADSVKDFPPDYFKQLAEGVEAISETQLTLTKSTMELIDAQGKLANAFANLPVTNQQRDNNQRTPDEGMMRLATSTQGVRQEQDLLARTTRDATNSLAQISDIPPQSQIAQKDSGFKAGFDYDTAKDIFLTGVGLAAASATTGVGLALSPEILAGAIVAAGVGGFAKGSYDATTATPELDNRLQPLSNIDLSAIVTPLSSIDANIQSFLQAVGNKEQPAEMTMPEWLSTPLNNFDTPLSSILQQMQDSQPYADDRLQELLGALPNIDANVLSVLQELQARAEIPETTADQLPATTDIDYLTPLSSIDAKLQSVLDTMPRQETISFETIVRPLDNIAGLVQNILTALENRQPPQITVSPNNNIDLGGAYVFDNAMKRELVDDITTRIVREITNAVQQATSRSSYGFSA